jgi:large subunit ribosomal protein L13
MPFLQGITMTTIFMKPYDVERKWVLIDADGASLGRVAAKAAYILRGKNKPFYTPHQEIGDYVVIVNAAKAKVTGRKETDKTYYHHTGFPGGIKSETYATLAKKHPTSPLELAIKGMLPSGVLGRKLLKNVKIYAGAEHPHVAQNPQAVKLG